MRTGMSQNDRQWTTGEYIGFMFFCLFCAMVGSLTIISIMASNSRPEKEARKQKWLQDNKCFLVGFYGRSGEYKTYQCNQIFLVKEQDIPT
jgi:hypothetical protein